MSPITPRGLEGIRIKRSFVNRTTEIHAFHKMYHNTDQRMYNILSIIGMGGIGKSRLIDEFRLDIDSGPWKSNTLISMVIDFDSRQFTSSVQSIDKILFLLRSEFRKQGVKFPTFDIAYTHYWEITRPEAPLRKNEIPFLSEGNFILEFLGDLKDVNNKISNFSDLIAESGILSKSLSAISSIWNLARNFYTRKTVASLAQLENMRPQEVASTLKFFFANDVLNHSRRFDKKILLFLDTFDSLQFHHKPVLSPVGAGSHNDWLKELIAELPNAMWVIAGRKSIRSTWGTDWEQFIEEANLDNLIDSESTKFLNAAQINDNSVINQIIKTSNGLPFSLEVMADQFFLISVQRVPLPTDFEYLPSSVVDRFCEYLTVPEFETLKLLTIPRFWTKELGKILIEGFNTGLSINALKLLPSYSFVKSYDHAFLMHDLMRNSLYEKLSSQEILMGHKILHSYYDSQLDNLNEISSLNEFQSIFSECLHHISEINTVSACEWFETRCHDTASGDYGNFLLDAANKLLSELEKEKRVEQVMLMKNLQYHIACLTYQLGKYGDSESLFIEISEFFKLINPVRYSDIQKLLSLSYMELSKYDDAICSLRNQIETTDNKLTLASHYTTLGVLYEKQGNYSYSLDHHLKAKIIFENLMVVNEQYVNIINNIGMVYVVKEQFQTSLDYFNEALRVYKENHMNFPLIAKIVNNQGVAYRSLGNIKDALSCFFEAYNIQESLYGYMHPEVARTKNNIGLLYQTRGNFSLAIEYFLSALEIQNVFFDTPNEITGYIHNNLAVSYQAKLDLGSSLIHAQKALEIRKAIFDESNPLVISTLVNLAGIYLDLGQLTDGYHALRKALKLSRQHLPGITLSEIYLQINIGRYRQKLNRQKKYIRSFMIAAEILDHFPGYVAELFFVYKELFVEFFKIKDLDEALKWNAKWRYYAELFEGKESQEYIESLLGESIIHKIKQDISKSRLILEMAYEIQIKISGIDSEQANRISSYLKSFD